MKLKKLGYYVIYDEQVKHEVYAQYMGKEKGWECSICGKGNNAHCFNVFDNLDKYDDYMYETWSYGLEHMPKIIRETTREELGRGE